MEPAGPEIFLKLHTAALCGRHWLEYEPIIDEMLRFYLSKTNVSKDLLILILLLRYSM
jgi:hypothetical protein